MTAGETHTEPTFIGSSIPLHVGGREACGWGLGHRLFISRTGRSRSPFRMLGLAFFAPDVPANGLRRDIVQLVKQLTSSPRPLARNKMLALV